MSEYWDSLDQDRAKGGFLTHYRLRGTLSAVCGFQPKAVRRGGRQMQYRHGWTHQRGDRLCNRCKEIADRDYRKHLLDQLQDPRI